MGLIEELKNFHEELDIDKLSENFMKLSKSFLYGGYIKVREDFKIYIRTVEFYYHSEKENGIYDPIVYHRNGRGLKKMPYFPIMTFNAHNSGFDITFENEKQEYRASALIRSYEIVTSGDKFLKWDSKKELFLESDSYQYNTQSTYLYTILNGFCNESEHDIEWVDELRIKSQDIKTDIRQNVFQSISKSNYKQFLLDNNKNSIKCDRNWSFTRKDTI